MMRDGEADGVLDGGVPGGETASTGGVQTIVVATSNAHKVAEIMRIINIEGVEFVPLSQLGSFPSPTEDGATFIENARIKAMAAHKETGLAAIADDSGIVVDALDGAPGIFSSRYSGDEGNDDANNAKLLAQMEGKLDRTGRFTCAIVFIGADGRELVSQASVEGKIDDHLHGDGGFGYDPLFLPDEYDGAVSMAELTMDQKNAISHRGKALREMRDQLVAHRCVGRLASDGLAGGEIGGGEQAVSGLLGNEAAGNGRFGSECSGNVRSNCEHADNEHADSESADNAERRGR